MSFGFVMAFQNPNGHTQREKVLNEGWFVFWHWWKDRRGGETEK